MCFALERDNGQRLFLVAHPEMFWAIDSTRPQEKRSSYEVIPEYVSCKLYLDIEFEYEYNKLSIGDRMLENFLKIINFNLKATFDISCEDNNILDLDSSTSKKYSHHIIYQLKNTAFQNNYVLGYFLKEICYEIKEAYRIS